MRPVIVPGLVPDPRRIDAVSAIDPATRHPAPQERFDRARDGGMGDGAKRDGSRDAAGGRLGSNADGGRRDAKGQGGARAEVRESAFRAAMAGGTGATPASVPVAGTPVARHEPRTGDELSRGEEVRMLASLGPQGTGPAPADAPRAPTAEMAAKIEALANRVGAQIDAEMRLGLTGTASGFRLDVSMKGLGGGGMGLAGVVVTGSPEAITVTLRHAEGALDPAALQLAAAQLATTLGARYPRRAIEIVSDTGGDAASKDDGIATGGSAERPAPDRVDPLSALFADR